LNTQFLDQRVVEVLAAVGCHRAESQFRSAWLAELASHDYVQFCVESARHLSRNWHAAAWNAEHQDMFPAERLQSSR
jgi:hypothetical protein